MRSVPRLSPHMKDQILQSQRSVQSNNQNFLVQENQRLKEQIEDLRQVLTMNKVQIDILSRFQQGNKGPALASQHDKKLMDLVYNYRVAYDQLRLKVSELRNLIQEKAQQNLILEQVNEQATRQAKAMEEFYYCNTSTLRQNIEQLQKRILLHQRDMKEYDGMTGFVIKNRDIFNPTEQAIQFRNHQIEWTSEIELMRDKVSEAKKTEENLIVANTLLRNKVVTLQAKLAMPNRNLGQILDKSLKRLMVYFIETQKKILTGDDSESSDEEDLQLIAPQLHGLYPQRERKKMHNKVEIPHLDLLKVRQAMVTGGLKIQQQLRKRNHLSKDERLERLEVELEYTRRQMSKNIIQLREEKDKRRRCQKIIHQLSNRNQILIESNQIYNKKVKKCLRQIQTNREKILSFIHSSARQDSTGHSRNQLNALNQLSFLSRDFNLDATMTQLNNPPPKLNHKTSKQQSKQLPIHLLNDPKLQFKIYMEMLQRQVDNNHKITLMKQNKLIDPSLKKGGSREGQPRTIKRSDSDPFLYFNERRQQIMEVNETRNQREVEEGFRLEQTEYMVPNAMANWARGADEDLDDVQI